jgi:hypothetical protein
MRAPSGARFRFRAYAAMRGREALGEMDGGERRIRLRDRVQ